MSDLQASGRRGVGLAYVRVANDIAARVASGELAPGAQLRAERDLAEHYGVAYGTVRRAMRELRGRGVILTIHGRGTFIARQGDTCQVSHGAAMPPATAITRARRSDRAIN